MSPVYSGDLDTAPAEEGLSTLPTSLGASLGATAHRAWSEGWTPEIADISGAEAAKGHMPSLGDYEAPLMGVPDELAKSLANQPEISIDAARQRVKESGLPVELPDRPTVKQGYLDLLLNRAREKREDEATIARGPGGFIPGALSVGTSFAVGAVDPVNAAAMFLPVVGEARYGKLLGSAADTIMGRAAVRAAAGAETGAYLGAAKVPLDLASAGEDGRDYGYVDALQSIIETAGTFGLMHGAFGFAGDVYRSLRGRPLERLGAGGEPATPGAPAQPASPVEREGGAPPTLLEAAQAAEPSATEEAPAAPSVTNIEARAQQRTLARYMSRGLELAGMPRDQARANAEVFAARYAARAERWGGQRGGPLDLFRESEVSVRAGEAGAESDAAGHRTFFQSAWLASLDARVKAGEPAVLSPETSAKTPRSFVDPNAKEWTLYHGTTAPTDFQRFDPQAAGQFSAKGEKGAIFLSPAAEEASHYASGQAREGAEAGPRVFRLKVRPGKTRVFDLAEMLRRQGPEFLRELREGNSEYSGAPTSAADRESLGRLFDERLARVMEEMRRHDDYRSADNLKREVDEGLLTAEQAKQLAAEPFEVPTGLGAATAAIRMARREGLDTAVIRGLRESHGGDQIVMLTPGRVHSDLSPGRLLYQQGTEGPRGSITFAENQAVIRLFKSADASTFMHEAAHLWFEEMIRDAAQSDAPASFKSDLGAVLKWLGVERPEDIGVDQHEQWAKGFERYLAEGKAPSSALKAVFEKFKRWLVAIYHSIADTGAPLSDEVRGVMDRLLATDKEMDAARPLDDSVGELFRTVDTAPAIAAVERLPAQAKHDLMQGTVAALTQGKPAPAMEMLRAGAEGDPRIADVVHQIGDSASGTVIPDQAWRALAETKSPETEPDAVDAFRRAENLEPPASVEASTEPEGEPRPLRPMESQANSAEAGERQGAEPEATPVGETGVRAESGTELEAPRRTSPATRAAVEADRRSAADFELLAGSLTDAERAQIDDVLRQIDLEESDWRSLVDAGAACLAIAVGA